MRHIGDAPFDLHPTWRWLTQRLAHGLAAWHPDQFITHLLDREPDTVCAAARQHRTSLKNPPKTVADYLATLERQSLPMTSARLQEFAAPL